MVNQMKRVQACKTFFFKFFFNFFKVKMSRNFCSSMFNQYNEQAYSQWNKIKKLHPRLITLILVNVFARTTLNNDL